LLATLIAVLLPAKVLALTVSAHALRHGAALTAAFNVAQMIAAVMVLAVALQETIPALAMTNGSTRIAVLLSPSFARTSNPWRNVWAEE
jgi:S-methylmethionine-dependent homocysteine/selenocysteine methylase